MPTKDKILNESLKLFSIKGFDATSIREIANEVGITNSGLYKHFANKEEIFTTLVEELKSYYLTICQGVVTEEIRGVQKVKEICLKMFHFQHHDEKILMFRKMLLLEQFKNQKMADIYKDFFVDIPLNSQIKIFKDLMDKEIMKKQDPRVLAMELYAPFFMYHLIDEKEEVLEECFSKHVENFFRNNIR